MFRTLPLAIATLAAFVPAQFDQAAGLGRPLPDTKFPNGGHLIDVQALVSNNGCLGCASAVVNGTRFYYVSARSATANGSHAIYKISDSGALVATINQPLTRGTLAPGVSAWGIRDLAWDGGNYIFGGAESQATTNTVYALDVRTDTWDTNATWKTPTSVTTCRALAYDPNGNNGQGSMWTGNFSAAVVEFDKAGNQLRTVPSINLVSSNQTASFYGAAYDPVRKTVWWFSQGGSSKGRAQAGGIRVVAFESTTVGTSIMKTGQVVFGDTMVAPSGTNPPGGIAGGCEFYVKNGKPTLLMLAQAASDSIYEISGRFNFGTGCAGTMGFEGDAPYGGNQNWAVKVENHPGGMGTAFLILAGRDFSVPAPRPVQSGCFLHFDPVAPFVAGSVSMTNGTATFPLPVPQNVVTGELVLQFATLSNGVLTTTDGGRARFTQ